MAAEPLGFGRGLKVAEEARQMGRPTLLISTGESADAFTLSRQAVDAGLSVITDTSAKVVELAVRYRPVIIVLDVQQMGGDGLEFLAQLRRNPATRSARVFATAATNDEFAKTMSLELGALGFSVKPFHAGFIRSIATMARESSEALGATAS
jgi:DNA-binding response OmpR family regulator